MTCNIKEEKINYFVIKLHVGRVTGAETLITAKVVISRSLIGSRFRQKQSREKPQCNICRTFRDSWWKTSLPKAVENLNRGKPDVLKREGYCSKSMGLKSGP